MLMQKPNVEEPGNAIRQHRRRFDALSSSPRGERGSGIWCSSIRSAPISVSGTKWPTGWRSTRPSCYDKRGHGLSGLGDGVASIDDHVDDLAGLLDRLGIDDVILCGLSIGGLIAQGFAMRRPQALRALILCDTAAKIGTTESWNARIETVERDGIEAIADSRHGEMVHAGLPRGAAGRPRRLPHHAGPAAGRRLCRQLRGGARRRLHARPRDASRCRRFCVVGDQDGSTPPDLVR